MKTLLKIISFILLVFASSAGAKNSDVIIVIAGGTVHGQYYNVANAFCDAVNKSKNIYCIPRMTEGSVENTKIVLEDKMSLGIAQEDVLKMHKDSGKMRAVLRLYPEVLFVVASPNSSMFAFTDLINQENINIGSDLPGDRQTAKNIMSLNNIKRESFKNIPRRDILSMLCKNAIDVSFLVNYNPSSFVVDIARKCNARIISLGDELIQKLLDENYGYRKFTIPKNSYPYQNSEVNTVSTEAILFANEEISEEIVYEFLKIIFSNQKSLQFYLPFLFDFTTKGILEKTVILHHKGVEKFLKDMESSSQNSNKTL